MSDLKTKFTPDTIFALASGQGKAGISVFRVSGVETANIVTTLSRRALPNPRMAALRQLKDKDGQVIDEGLVIYFPGPNSFTGEDLAEFQVHGSHAVISALSDAFLRLGLRQARPGEFTRRAFDNGRIDLTQAEGLADLIDAETEGQRRQALRQMQGGLESEYESWKHHLIDALAFIEGDIDFPDEQDVPDHLSHKAFGPLEKAALAMETLLADAGRGQAVRSGIHVAIIGPPNAGKSTLLNRLAQRDAAIVSDIAGTTRDVIDIALDIGGLPVRFSDTAGLRAALDPIEKQGIARAKAEAASADLRIGIIAADAPGDINALIQWMQPGDIFIINKTDLRVPGINPGILPQHSAHFSMSLNSGQISDQNTHQGYEDFFTHLSGQIRARFAVTQNAGLTRARHKDCTHRAAAAIRAAQSQLVRAPELAGDDVRRALTAIDELAGRSDIEAVLGAIFARFCIGK